MAREIEFQGEQVGGVGWWQRASPTRWLWRRSERQMVAVFVGVESITRIDWWTCPTPLETIFALDTDDTQVQPILKQCSTCRALWRERFTPVRDDDGIHMEMSESKRDRRREPGVARARAARR
jgi:hypothetical protein